MTSLSAARYDYVNGALVAGKGDLDQLNVTVPAAEKHCAATPECLGFSYDGA